MKAVLSLVTSLALFLLLPPGWWTVVLLVAVSFLGVGALGCLVRRYEEWRAWDYPSNHAIGGWR